MATVCVVGAQWGDEGKAGIVDVLSSDADWVVRFQGGPNAGHTVVVGEETFKLHLVPSGIVRPAPRCLIGQSSTCSSPAGSIRRGASSSPIAPT